MANQQDLDAIGTIAGPRAQGAKDIAQTIAAQTQIGQDPYAQVELLRTMLNTGVAESVQNGQWPAVYQAVAYLTNNDPTALGAAQAVAADPDNQNPNTVYALIALADRLVGHTNQPGAILQNLDQVAPQPQNIGALLQATQQLELQGSAYVAPGEPFARILSEQERCAAGALGRQIQGYAPPGYQPQEYPPPGYPPQGYEPQGYYGGYPQGAIIPGRQDGHKR